MTENTQEQEELDREWEIFKGAMRVAYRIAMVVWLFAALWKLDMIIELLKAAK